MQHSIEGLFLARFGKVGENYDSCSEPFSQGVGCAPAFRLIGDQEVYVRRRSGFYGLFNIAQGGNIRAAHLSHNPKPQPATKVSLVGTSQYRHVAQAGGLDCVVEPLTQYVQPLFDFRQPVAGSRYVPISRSTRSLTGWRS